jgi:hypothetical protein
MAITSVEIDDLPFLEALNAGGDLNDSGGSFIFLVLLLVDTALSEGVESPGVDKAISGDGKRVVRAGVNGSDLLAGDSNLTGNGTLESSALNHAAAKLRLLSASPGPGFTLVVQCNSVIVTADDGDDVFELLDQNGGLLDTGGRRESQNSLVATEGSPSVNKAGIGDGKGDGVTGGDAGDNGSLGEGN